MTFWLKRVESFLESVDQSAAAQLNTPNTPTGQGDNATTQQTFNSNTTYSNGSSRNSLKPSSTPPQSTTPRKLDDEDIFKFLNDTNDPPPTTTYQKLPLPAPKISKSKKEAPKQPKKSINPTSPSQPPQTITTTSTAQETAITVPPITPPSPPPQSLPSPKIQSSPREEEANKEQKVDEHEENKNSASPRAPSPTKSPRDSSNSPRLITPADTAEDQIARERKASDVSSRSSEAPEVEVGEEEEKVEATGDSVAPPMEVKIQEGHSENIDQKTEEATKDKEEISEGDVHPNGEEGEEEGNESEGENDTTSLSMDAEFVQKYNDMLTDNAKFSRENKLMREQVLKLHGEIGSINNKCRSLSDALAQATEVLSEHQKIAQEKDKQIQKLMQQEKDLETALHAKDMQQSGLRAQYEQIEKTLKSRDTALANYQERIEKLMKEKEALLDGSQRSSQQIQDKVDELERMMMEEKSQHIETQNIAKAREAELQAAMAEYTKSLAMTQRSLDEKSLELQRNLVMIKETQSECKTLRQELVDYKLRATKVLQSKEKTIQELTNSLAAQPGSGDATANLGELLRVQHEREAVQQERDEMSHTIDQLRTELQDVQAQAEADSEVFRTQLANSEEALEKERKRVQALQIDMLTRSGESAHAQKEAECAMMELKEALKAKEAEIAKLRRQISSKSQSSSSQMELENRLRSTTDHLLQKQAQIDTLLSEKSFLQLQLEHAVQNIPFEPQKKRDRQSGSKAEHIPISIKTDQDDTEEPRIRQRPIASLVPASAQPNFVSKRVVGAANFLDKMSTSAGRVMRQSPLARLLVILYITLIHLMGFYIMASWNPEMHEDGFQKHP